MPRLKTPGHVDCTLPIHEEAIADLRRIAAERSGHRRVTYGDVVREAIREKIEREKNGDPRQGRLRFDSITCPPIGLRAASAFVDLVAPTVARGVATRRGLCSRGAVPS